MEKTIIPIIILLLINTLAISQNFYELPKVNSEHRDENEGFGTSVSISGNSCLVGASGEGKDLQNENYIENAGAAFIFELDSLGCWIQSKKLIAPDRNVTDLFGLSVSIHGNTALVGAHSNDFNESSQDSIREAGAAYFYEKNNLGQWEFIQKVVAFDRDEGAWFGSYVSVFNNYAIISSRFDDNDETGSNPISGAGSTYVYEKSQSGQWNFVQKLIAPDRAFGDRFGISNSIFENYLVIGAYREDDDTNGENTLDDSGSAYIFKREQNGQWNFNQKIIAFDRDDNDNFGESVSISGNYAVIGASAEDEDHLGENTINSAGSAYIFKRNQLDQWNFIQKITASDRAQFDQFGESVSISNNTIVTGAFYDDENFNGEATLNNAGSVYVFKRNNLDYWDEVQKISASDRNINDELGRSVSIDSSFIICGVKNESENIYGNDSLFRSGSSYIFKECLFPSYSSIDTSVCDYYEAPNGKFFNSSGSFTTTIPNSIGCDSVITVNLTINNSLVMLTESYCDSFITINNEVFYDSGLDTTIYQNSYGCDSITITNFTINSSSEESIVEMSCDSFTLVDGITIFESGVYSSLFTTTLGCDSIINTEVVIIALDNTVNQELNSISSNQFNAEYQWLDCDNGYIPVINETNQTFSPLINGNYAVEITNGECSTLSECFQVIIVNTIDFENSAIWFYPNPMDDKLTIENNSNKEIKIKLIDSKGKRVLTKILLNKKSTTNLDYLIPGLYYLIIHFEDNIITRKIIKN